MGYTQFLGEAEHIHQHDSQITQRHGNQARITEKTVGMSNKEIAASSYYARHSDNSLSGTLNC